MNETGTSSAAVVVGVVGPTGSGKSDLALEIAEQFRGEIVGCDALQVYRGLDVGTAKLAPAERRGIPHHLIDVVEPSQEFSAAQYIERAAPAIRAIASRGKLPILVGGTGLYLRALRRGLFPGPGRAPEIRERLVRIRERRGSGTLHRVLAKRDPASAERIHPNDGVRLVRALEVLVQSGRPMSELMEIRERPLNGFRDILLGLAPGREVLVPRIERRVAAMFDGGLVDEVRELSRTYGPELPAFKAIGYREARAALEGRIDWSLARELTVGATAKYAKRQMTWFRREDGIEWFHGCGDEPETRRAVMRYLQHMLEGDFRHQERETLHAETTS